MSSKPTAFDVAWALSTAREWDADPKQVCGIVEEACDEIEQLTARTHTLEERVAKLRAALGSQLDLWSSNSVQHAARMRGIARDALAADDAESKRTEGVDDNSRERGADGRDK